MSGYTNPEESEHDMFNVGHTSTSISLATGLAKARDLKGDKENIIAIIGDGSMSGGEALEGLDTAGEMDSNLIILFNDNDMSIAEVHGGMYKGFKELRDTNSKSERNLFKAMGLNYRFVADGNDTEALIAVFNEVKDIDHPVVVHIVTQKGKGYKFAEENKEDWHMPFDIETGEVKQPMVDPYAEQTAKTFLQMAKDDEKFIAISAVTPSTILTWVLPKNRLWPWPLGWLVMVPIRYLAIMRLSFNAPMTSLRRMCVSITVRQPFWYFGHPCMV